MTLILFYLLITLVIGFIAWGIAATSDQPVGCLYDTSFWPENKSRNELDLIFLYTYTVSFSFAICYWIYRFITWRKKK